jgi:hypothetical protein
MGVAAALSLVLPFISGGSTAVATAVATIIATTITGVAMFLTQKSAASAAQRNAETTSRSALEEEAFSRAKAYYTDTIDRQSREISELESDVGRLKRQVDACEIDLGIARQEMKRMKRDLATAEAALKLRYPDE